MTTDVLELDKNFNSIITEEKISHSNGTIYKIANRYKHNDIVYIPTQNNIKKQLLTLTVYPKRFKNIQGTKRFKELKDYFLAFNLLQQYLAPHEENKELVALDNRYLRKALGNRTHNGNSSIFSRFFKLEIKGRKNKYTSGYSLTLEGKSLQGKYNKVVHKDKIDGIIESVLDGSYDETNVKNIGNIKETKDIPTIINDSYIEIPRKNIDLVLSINGREQNKKIILQNYIDGKLYYTKSYKDYGRNYSYIHTLSKEIRTALFDGFNELDINTAAQSILYKLTSKYIKTGLINIKHYINNKVAVRNELSDKYNLSASDVKEFLQIITFSKKVPTKNELSFYGAFKEYSDCIEDEFIIGLGKDYDEISEILFEKYGYNEEVFNKKPNKVDIRVFYFQNYESKIMEYIQKSLSEKSFHLHDAIYVNKVSDKEILKIQENLKKK